MNNNINRRPSMFPARLLCVVAAMAAACVAGCDEDKSPTIKIAVENDISLCPYNVPVCTIYSAADQSQGAANPADVAWEKYQEYLHFRPNSPAFRAMSTLLDGRRLGDWNRMILIEYIVPTGGSTRGGFSYAFAAISDAGGNPVLTNFTGQGDLTPENEIRRFDADPIATDVCMATLETAAARLPSALVWDVRRSDPLIVLHYFQRGSTPWSCAISDAAVLEAITLSNTDILKKEASNQDVIAAMGTIRADAGRGFSDAVYNQDQQEQYDKVRNRYASIIAQVWRAVDKPKPPKKDEKSVEESSTSQPATQTSAKPMGRASDAKIPLIIHTTMPATAGGTQESQSLPESSKSANDVETKLPNEMPVRSNGSEENNSTSQPTSEPIEEADVSE